MIKPIVLYTDHFVSRRIAYAFSRGASSYMCHIEDFKDFSKTIATYGYLRGAGEAIKKSKNYIYIDHGYFVQSSRTFKNKSTQIENFDGYFRIVLNNFWHDGDGSFPDDRLKKLNLSFKDTRKQGEHIIVSEPTNDAAKYYNLENWTNKTISEIKKYSDRKIIRHNRNSETPLSELLNNAWAFVSDHSSAGFQCMIEGIPSYFTNQTLQKISKISEIEESKIKHSIFNNLAYGQWTLEEIYNGTAWSYVSTELNA